MVIVITYFISYPISYFILSRILSYLNFIASSRKVDPLWQDLNQRGRNALHVGCMVGNIEIVDLLIQVYKVNINITDYEGNTVLHYCAMGNQLNMIKHLYTQYEKQITFKQTTKNKQGATAYDIGENYLVLRQYLLPLLLKAQSEEEQEQGGDNGQYYQYNGYNGYTSGPPPGPPGPPPQPNLQHYPPWQQQQQQAQHQQIGSSGDIPLDPSSLPPPPKILQGPSSISSGTLSTPWSPSNSNTNSNSSIIRDGNQSQSTGEEEGKGKGNLNSDSIASRKPELHTNLFLPPPPFPKDPSTSTSSSSTSSSLTNGNEPIEFQQQQIQNSNNNSSAFNQGEEKGDNGTTNQFVGGSGPSSRSKRSGRITTSNSFSSSSSSMTTRIIQADGFQTTVGNPNLAAQYGNKSMGNLGGVAPPSITVSNQPNMYSNFNLRGGSSSSRIPSHRPAYLNPFQNTDGQGYSNQSHPNGSTYAYNNNNSSNNNNNMTNSNLQTMPSPSNFAPPLPSTIETLPKTTEENISKQQEITNPNPNPNPNHNISSPSTATKETMNNPLPLVGETSSTEKFFIAPFQPPAPPLQAPPLANFAPPPPSLPTNSSNNNLKSTSPVPLQQVYSKNVFSNANTTNDDDDDDDCESLH